MKILSRNKTPNMKSRKFRITVQSVGKFGRPSAVRMMTVDMEKTMGVDQVKKWLINKLK